MAKTRITPKLAEEIKKNNIDLARELSKRKEKITDLNVELQQTRFLWLDTERRLAAANTKNFAIQNEVKELKQHNQKLQVDLKGRDEKLADWHRLFISTFASATQKYSNIMHAVGAFPAATTIKQRCSTDDERDDDNDDDKDDTKFSNGTRATGVLPTATTKVMTNTMPSENDDDSEFDDDDENDDDEAETSNDTLQNETAGDSSDTTECDSDGDESDVAADVHVAASPSSIPLNADTTLVNSVQQEFSDDAIAELSLTVDQLHETLKNATLEQIDDSRKDETFGQEEPASIPSITVTECTDANDTHTPVKVPKQKKSNGLLQVPKLSFGKRKSEPRTSLNSKSSPTFNKHLSLTPKSERRTTILNRIHERTNDLSPLAKSPGSPISTGIRDKKIQQTIHRSPVSNDTENQPVSPKGRKKTTASLQTKTPVSIQSTKMKTEPSLPKRIFKRIKDVNNNSTNNAMLTSSPKPPALPNPVASIKTEASPEDCIARRRTTRRAAPTDLRDPVLLLKKRRKFL